MSALSMMTGKVLRSALVLTALGLAGPALCADQTDKPTWSSESTTGPLIEGYGPVFAIQDSANPAPLQGPLKAAFDVSAVAAAPDAINRRIETVARYLNMHVASGVAASEVQAALVLHGGASRAVLNDAAYRERYGVANPNLPLLAALHEAGVAIYLCGQTAASRGLQAEEISPLVKVALSAMTAHVQLQDQGYSLIPF